MSSFLNQYDEAELTIDLGAVVRNSQRIRQLAPTAQCAAMVKADAYGLGLAQVSTALHADGLNIFFVASVAEALCLRAQLSDAVIYVLNGFFPGQGDVFKQHHLCPVLNSLEQIQHWAHEGQGPAAVHFDTGMNRLGLSPRETDKLLGTLSLLDNVELSLVMSHLACADIPDHPLNQDQLQAFLKIADAFPDVPKSLANSAGILLGQDYHFDLVRPGLALYGGVPCPHVTVPFEAVFTATAKILQIREVEAGMSVGYEATYVFDKPARIATLNVGYADGYLQSFNNCGAVKFKGRTLPVLGKVSMDMLAIDVTTMGATEVAVGDDVELFGVGQSLFDASQRGHVSQYEILTLLGKRYKRRYKT